MLLLLCLLSLVFVRNVSVLTDVAPNTLGCKYEIARANAAFRAVAPPLADGNPPLLVGHNSALHLGESHT